jgi:hypothetical protein
MPAKCRVLALRCGRQSVALQDSLGKDAADRAVQRHCCSSNSWRAASWIYSNLVSGSDRSPDSRHVRQVIVLGISATASKSPPRGADGNGRLLLQQNQHEAQVPVRRRPDGFGHTPEAVCSLRARSVLDPKRCLHGLSATWQVSLRSTLCREPRRHTLTHGVRLSDAAFQASEASLVEFVKVRGNTKSHLADLM